MPRKSLPATNSTPKRNSLPNRANTSVKRSTRQVSSTPTRPKRKRGQLDIDNDAAEDKPPTSAELVLGPEKELEAWQDFAADHYEMIEQLPLELHRSFRLLRELDETCTSQTTELQKVIRRYIAKRMNVKDNPEPPTDTRVEPNGDGIEQTAGDLAPIPDGEGGLIVPAAEDASGREQEGQEQVNDRRAFPDHAEQQEDVDMVEDAMGELEKEEGVDHQERVATRDNEQSADPGTGRASLLLPEIGRLAREMVRNGEEKVALAVGAYNAIDRHIRALDSALSAHEASILLGLRADTNPSAAVEPDGEQIQGVNAASGEQDEVTIGMGGGGSRKKKGKKQKGVEEVIQVPAVPDPLLDLEIDPNEPRYCYCNNVSYGQMVGCENDECPLEWFHLACIGLTQPPTGKWWCNKCKPKTEQDKAATGMQKHKQKRGKGWSRK